MRKLNPGGLWGLGRGAGRGGFCAGGRVKFHFHEMLIFPAAGGWAGKISRSRTLISKNRESEQALLADHN